MSIDKSQAPCGVEWGTAGPADCVYCENERVVITTEIRHYITKELAAENSSLADFIGQLHSVEYAYAKCPECNTSTRDILDTLTEESQAAGEYEIPALPSTRCKCSHKKGSHYNGEMGCFQCLCSEFAPEYSGTLAATSRWAQPITMQGITTAEVLK